LIDEGGGGAGQASTKIGGHVSTNPAAWNDVRARLYHYRTKDQVEVDAVVETMDGRVIGVETKAGGTVRAEDLAGLRNLRDRLGEKFIAGFVLYAGQQTLPFGDRLRALPLEALWNTRP